MCILPEACLYDLRDEYIASRRSIHWEHVPFFVDPAAKASIARLQNGRRANREMRAAVFDVIAEVKPLWVYGDKLPQRYLDQMIELARRLPNARFIVTIRDGRDVVASQIRWYHERLREGSPIEWWMRPTVAEAQGVWLAAMRAWERARSKIPPERWLEVEYDLATHEPEVTMQQICRLLGVPYRRDAFAEGLQTYRPVHTRQWQLEWPMMPAQLSWSFTRMLRRWGYR